jgi:cell division protein FtsZ
VVNPLLDDITLRGAKSLLLSISGGSDLTLFEVHDAVDYVREQLDMDANIIFGATLDESLVGRIRVSIVASGMARSDTLAVHARTERAPAADPRAGQDFRDRLSEAIGGYGQQDAAPAHNSGRRDTWQGPGDVVIRDDNAGREANARAHRSQDRPPAGNGRSMPAVEDFPPVAQREYWAKASDTGAPAGRSRHNAHHESDTPQRRPGLLQRLTGAGRDRRPESNRRDKNSAHDGNGAGSHGSDEQVDLPVFFGRDKRS